VSLRIEFSDTTVCYVEARTLTSKVMNGALLDRRTHGRLGGTTFIGHALGEGCKHTVRAPTSNDAPLPRS
jgi:hypothetical protein